MKKYNVSSGHFLWIAFGITVLAILSLASGASALSYSGEGSWQYYKDITISNDGGTALNDYQVLVNLTSDNFPQKASISGDDIIFVDAGNNELNYWIESWDHDSHTAKVWVNVTNIPAAGSTVIRMYYGNPNAISASNGTKTFEFFDDFEDDLIGETPKGWVFWSGDNGGRYSTTTDYQYDGTKSLKVVSSGWGDTSLNHKLPKPASNSVFQLKSYPISPTYGDHGFYISNYPHRIEYTLFSSNSMRTRYFSPNYPDAYHSTTGTFRNNEWNSLEIRNLNGGFELYANGNKVHEVQDFGVYSFTDIYIEVDNADSKTSYWDQVIVRKYTSPEPSVKVGAEISNVAENFTFAHITDVHIGYYPGKHYCIDSPFNTIECTSNNMGISVENFTDILHAVDGEKPRFILITGDIVQYDNRDFFMAFRNLIRGIKIPVNTTPGNHDRRNVVTEDNLLDYNHILNPINNPKNLGENNYSFDYMGYRFIGLDSGADDEFYPDFTPESGGLSEDQMIRLRSEFNSISPKIVFMHHPVISEGQGSDGAPGDNDGTITNNRWNFTNYTRDNNVQLVLTGHSHENAIFNLSGVRDANNSLNRPLFIQTQNRGYRIIDVKDGKVNPYNSETTPRFIRDSGALEFKPDITGVTSRLGLHTFDFSGGHTGMITGCDDFELGIPDSYYTGDYGGSFTPQVIVDYSPIKEFKIYSCQRINTLNSMMNTRSLSNSQNIQALENVPFNLTIEKQRETFTTGIYFYNANIMESSIAIVNVNDLINGYKMDIDLDGDGTIDQVINPDSIDTTLLQPQNNIDIIAYNGAGTINLATGKGYFIRASNINPLSVSEKPAYEFPYGLFAFNITGLRNGETIDLTITLPKDITPNTQYWKYGSTSDDMTPHWYLITPGSNDGDNVITLQLQDGGIGDDDLTENGIIVDTGGPGIPLIGDVTGGGWILTAPSKKANFGFVAHYENAVAPSGNLKYDDNAAGLKINGNVTILSVDRTTGTSTFGGTARVNGVDGYAYMVTVTDNGEPGNDDTFAIRIPSISYKASGALMGGNIQVHK